MLLVQTSSDLVTVQSSRSSLIALFLKLVHTADTDNARQFCVVLLRCEQALKVAYMYS